MSLRRALLSKWQVGGSLAASAIMTASISYLDAMSGPHVRVFGLYFLPVGLVAWKHGPAVGMCSAALAVAGWEAAHRFESGYEHASGLAAAWNAGMLTLTFSIFAWMAGRVSQLLQRERTQSRHDSLTGLLNLRGFEERAGIEFERAARYGTRFVLAFIDLDNFKQVNDIAGHATGDRLLREVAAELRRSLRASDVVARVGGDEFCVAFPETDEEAALSALERVRERVEALPLSAVFGVSASIGCKLMREKDESLEQLLRDADQVMYEAKRNGKNAVRTRTSGGLGGEVGRREGATRTVPGAPSVEFSS